MRVSVCCVSASDENVSVSDESVDVSCRCLI